MKAFRFPSAPWIRVWLLSLLVLAANAGTALVAVAQVGQYDVDTITALRGLSSATYSRVFVAGYFARGDGGGGFYSYIPGDTDAENGGTTIVALDGARWVLSQSEPPSIRQFGAVKGTGSDNAPAIQNALNACLVVTVPPGDYRCDGPITINDQNALIGLGVRGDSTNAALTTSAKLIFYGTGDACFTSSSSSNLPYAKLENLAINVDSTASYGWIMHFTEPVGMILSNLSASTAVLSTGGIRCNVRASSPGPSWMNQFYNVQIALPSYAPVDGVSPTPGTSPSFDVDFTDSQITGCYFTGGIGVVVRGPGPVAFGQAHFTGSGGYNLTLVHDILNSASADGFVNCMFASPASGEILINLDAQDFDVPNIAPRFVGNSFVEASPLISPLITVLNASGPAQTGGGVFSGNTFLNGPTAVYNIAHAGAGWTIAHNKYRNPPDFSALTAATVDEERTKAFASGTVRNALVVMGQSGTPFPHTGNLTETTLASIPIPAHSLAQGGKLRISATFSVNSSLSGKTARIRFGNGILGTAFYVGAVNGTSTLIHTICEISSSATAPAENAEVTAHAQTDTGPGLSDLSVVNGTVNGAIDQAVVLTGTLANAGDQITLQQYTVELLNQ